MKSVSRFELLREFDEIKSALSASFDGLSVRLNEKFLKDSDPSMSVLAFIESVGSSMSSIKKAYAGSGADRNNMIPSLLEELDQIELACSTLREKISESKSDPEDTNDSIGEG